ncbi:efflux RND transporter periplasmic adaptor subunit [Aquabacterium sp.]|uniref:efflux RND transporter periplasmic adaptor subunit n=1 Tax=Aquabacterium sp. TaxID=1872578 RepID=UPI0035AF7D6C
MKPLASPTLAAALLACAALLSACGDHNAAAAAPAAAPTVGVLRLAPSSVRLTTELSGRTAPYQVAEVRPQVEGIIKSRLFTEGGDVKAGQALYQIDAAKYEADANSAKAALAKAQANLTTAALKAQRYGELAGIDAVSKQANDDAQAALKQAQADVASAQAALRTAQINLDYTRVNAPISGRIGRSSVTPGALVTANQATTLATIQQLDPIYVDVTQSSSELLRLQNALASGQLKRSTQTQAKVKLLLEDGSTYPLDGKLEFSEVTVDPSTGTVTLRATFPNPKHLLLPGMYVRAVVEEGESEQALLVPQKAVSRDAKGNATALVLGDDGKVQARTLQAARSVGDQWLVTAGLQAGDRVIVEGLQKVRPGAPAQADETKPGAAPTATPSAPASQAAPASAAR